MMSRPRFTPLLLVLLAAPVATLADEPRLLVYTRSYTPDGKGYVHANIAHSVEALKSLGAEMGCAVDSSDDPAVFTPENLKKYRVLIFSNSNNEAFTSDAQREAFQGFIKAGGGFVGIHSATGSERNWPYYWSVAGGKFRRHPKLQKFVVRLKDPAHPVAAGVPATFEWEDECYYHEFLNPDIHPLLVTDPTKLNDGKIKADPGALLGDSVPLAWTLKTDAGRTFYLALGHKPEHYDDPLFRTILRNGIRWTMGEPRP